MLALAKRFHPLQIPKRIVSIKQLKHLQVSAALAAQIWSILVDRDRLPALMPDLKFVPALHLYATTIA